MRSFVVAAFVAASILHPQPQQAEAAVTAAPGLLYARQILAELTEGCVAQGRGGLYVGVGPALSFPADGGTRDIVFVTPGGAVRTVATGLNSIGDCAYDADADVLYVTDSGLEFTGATTGDTVFAIPGNAEAVAVDGLEVLPAGSIPFAFGIELFDGGLLVTDAAGAGAGSVVQIDLAAMPAAASTFASGFDYTGGLVVDGARVLVSEALDGTFESLVSSFSTAGVFEEFVSGPTYAHGTVDLAIAADGRVLATGNDTIVAIDAMGGTTPLVTGLDGGTGFAAFGGGVAVDGFSGRIDFLASSFSGADDDRSIHRLVSIDTLLPGGGAESTDCILEFQGLQLVPAKPGKPAKKAICVDGEACDADGLADGACTFPVGLCTNVNDARLASCDASGIASVQLLAAKPSSAAVEELVEAMQAAAPIGDSTCFFSDGMRVPLKVTKKGASRPGKGVLKVRAVTNDAKARKDTDVVKLECRPALP